MARLRYNNQTGSLDIPITSTSATSFQSAALVYLPAINQSGSGEIDYLPITFNPQGDLTNPPYPEISYITSHTANSNTATILRGCEGSPQGTFAAGTVWAHTSTADDYVMENICANGNFNNVLSGSPTRATEWQYNFNGSGANITYGLSTTNVPFGLQSLSIQSTAVNATGIVGSKTFPIFAGETIEVSGFLSGYGGNNGNATVSFYELNSSSAVQSTFSTSWNVTSNTTYIPFTFTAVVTGSNPLGVIGLANQGNPSTGTVYFAGIKGRKSTPGLTPWLPGDIKLTGASIAPPGWLICNGAQYSSSVYGNLFSVIGNTFGGTYPYFYVPDFRGRTPVGVGVSPLFGSIYNLGQQGGAEGYQLFIPQMPAHNHAINDPGHAHGPPPGNNNYITNVGSGGSSIGYAPGSDLLGQYPNTATNTTGIVVGTTGGASPYNVLQPYLGTNFIIKY